MSKIVTQILILFSLVTMAATPAGSAQGLTYNPQLEYLKAINSSGPAKDPQLIFLLMSHYINANRLEEGIAFYEAFLEKYQGQMPPEQQSLYLAALGALRASQAKDVFLLRRIGWVRDTIVVLERARELSGNQIFVVRWITGTVYAQLPGWFGKQQMAFDDLQWCLENRAKAPHGGFLREVYFRLAILYQDWKGDKPQALAYLKRSGYRKFDDHAGLTTQLAENELTGHTFTQRRLKEIVPGKVYALSGFEFTEYYFVITADRKQLIGIDAGTRPDSAQAAYEYLSERTPGLPPLTTIFITHSHWDHIGGHTYFRRINPAVRFYARDNYAQELRRSLETPVRNRYFFGSKFQPELISGFRPDIAIDRKTDLTLGGTRITLIPIAGGETDDGMFIHLPDESVTFVGDFVMPYFGAPFVEEGNIEGLFQAVDVLAALAPKYVLHGHEPLTRVFGSVDTLVRVKPQLEWLHQATLEQIRTGAGRAEIHHRNLIPPTLLANPAAHLPYLLMREHLIDRVYDQKVGYWQPGLQGMDQVSPAEMGAALTGYLRISEQQLADAIEKMLANGDHELAGRLVNLALTQFPDSQSLRQLKIKTFEKLREKYQEYDPFKFIIYSEEIKRETPQLE